MSREKTKVDREAVAPRRPQNKEKQREAGERVARTTSPPLTGPQIRKDLKSDGQDGGQYRGGILEWDWRRRRVSDTEGLMHGLPRNSYEG